MRWLWIDRFLEFECGKRAVAIKNVSLVEEELDGYFSGFPFLPSSLIIEGMAQTGGLLVGEVSDFRERVVLAKVSKAIFHQSALPGDQLMYTAEIADINAQGAIVRGTSHIGEQLQAEIELVFAQLDSRFGSEILFEPEEFRNTLRLFRLYEVAKTATGGPKEPPEHLLEAYRNAFETTS
jgi:3-hydroxyacyl-[acyl-carrier-protein] dehydratase